ncbi:hypothetical protein Tco_1024139 [Tanacetum coccineum]
MHSTWTKLRRVCLEASGYDGHPTKHCGTLLEYPGGMPNCQAKEKRASTKKKQSQTKKKWKNCRMPDHERNMDLIAFIRTADPTKVKVGERQHVEDEPKLLDSTVRLFVPLLPISPDRSEGELKASIYKLFDEGGGTEQGDSVVGDDDAAETGVVRIIDDETEHGTSSRAAIGGESPSAIKELLARSILNVEASTSAMPTLPFVTSLVSATPEHESDVPVDSVTRVNLRNNGPAKRFVIPSDSSHHSSINFAEAEVDSLARSSVPVMTTATTVTSSVDPAAVVKEKLVEPSPFFAGSSSASGTNPITGDFLDLTGSDFLIGVIRTVIDSDADLQKV